MRSVAAIQAIKEMVWLLLVMSLIGCTGLYIMLCYNMNRQDRRDK